MLSAGQPFEFHKLMFGPTGTPVVFRVLPANGQTQAIVRKMERISIVTKGNEKGAALGPPNGSWKGA